VLLRQIVDVVEKLYSRLRFLDGALVHRLGEWLAFHISSFDFSFPWRIWYVGAFSNGLRGCRQPQGVSEV